MNKKLNKDEKNHKNFIEKCKRIYIFFIMLFIMLKYSKNIFILRRVV